jgi:hypothetical protein
MERAVLMLRGEIKRFFSGSLLLILANMSKLKSLEASMIKASSAVIDLNSGRSQSHSLRSPHEGTIIKKEIIINRPWIRFIFLIVFGM